jgi:hypothetical protein
MCLYSHILVHLDKLVRMKISPVLLILMTLCFPQAASGQYYETGQDPASLKWMEVRTGNFTVIYPKQYGREGLRFAGSLEKAYRDLAALYPGVRIRIPVIIHNYTIESNGYVAWAPSRMEIYPTPEQNSIPLDADRQLALHELTHVLQMQSLNTGFTKALSYVAGQQIPGFVSSLLPQWFLEGDAVFSESLLSPSGRGRTPSFLKELKAIIITKGRMYKYDKALNGSFRDHVPDYYQSGYQAVAWSYLMYGKDIWRKAIKTTGDLPFTVNPVNLSLMRNGPTTKKRLFSQAFDTLAALWLEDDERSGFRVSQVVNPSKKGKYADYSSPVFAGSDSIIAVKSTLSEPPLFVLINEGRKPEKRLLVPGYGYPWYLSCAKGKLVWTEMRSDPRWENRSWSVIMLMDLKTGNVHRLTSGSRYMSAAISPDATRIAASENGPDNSNSLVIIDTRDGSIQERIPAPGNAYLQRPRWDESGRKIIVISLTDAGEGIHSFDLLAKRWETLINESDNDLQSAFLRNDSLFYISSASGTDNAFVKPGGGPVKLLTRSRFGVSDLDMKDGKMLFSDYSGAGNDICLSTVKGQISEGTPYDYSGSFLIDRFKPAVQHDTAAGTVLKPVPYRKWLHLFRFHSWMPFYADIEKVQSDPASLRPGLTLLSQNDLSTLISSLGYEYSNKLHQFHYNLKWYGWYLTFSSQLDYGFRPEINKFGSPVGEPSVVERGYRLTNTVALPLLFQGGRFTKYLYLSGSSALQNTYNYISEKGIYDNSLNEITGRIYFSNYQVSAPRDIYPRWAQTIDISYSSYPFDKYLYRDQLTARGSFYFPGLFRNNGVRIRLEGEKQDPVRFILQSRASFPRGYSGIIMKEVGFGSADYFFPLLYPDFHLSSLLYLTRIRTSLFYDFARIPGQYVFTLRNGVTELVYQDIPEDYRSSGAELLADFYVFRLPFRFSAGVQAAWRQKDNRMAFAALFNINVFGMNIGQRHSSLNF